MQVERGVMGSLPWAAVGSGRPLVVLSGLSPHTGVSKDWFVRATIAPVAKLAESRRIFALNRRRHLPDGLTMSEFAEEHAEAFRSYFGEPVDLIGMSTGGSIAQQLAADHPDTVRRLVVLSSACRLGPVGRDTQAAIAAELRRGRVRRAMFITGADLLPKIGWIPGAVGWMAGRRLVAGSVAAADLATTLEAEDDFDLARCRAAIQAPTLIVAGGRDHFYGRALCEETAALIPGSQLLMFPNKGHVTVTSSPKARAHIEGFLSFEPPVGSGAED